MTSFLKLFTSIYGVDDLKLLIEPKIIIILLAGRKANKKAFRTIIIDVCFKLNYIYNSIILHELENQIKNSDFI